jgi:hypothetical protein
MVEHDFCSGGGKGYVGSFCSFLKGFARTTKETGNDISQSPGYVNEEDMNGELMSITVTL